MSDRRGYGWFMTDSVSQTLGAPDVEPAPEEIDLADLDQVAGGGTQVDFNPNPLRGF